MHSSPSVPPTVVCSICQGSTTQLRPLGGHRLQYIHADGRSCVEWFHRQQTRDTIYHYTVPPDWVHDSD
jgi:hypothetical protein